MTANRKWKCGNEGGVHFPRNKYSSNQSIIQFLISAAIGYRFTSDQSIKWRRSYQVMSTSISSTLGCWCLVPHMQMRFTCDNIFMKRQFYKGGGEKNDEHSAMKSTLNSMDPNVTPSGFLADSRGCPCPLSCNWEMNKPRSRQRWACSS